MSRLPALALLLLLAGAARSAESGPARDGTAEGSGGASPAKVTPAPTPAPATAAKSAPTSAPTSAPASASPAGAPDAKAAPVEPSWVRQVYAIVRKAMEPLSYRLPHGTYGVHFLIDEEGRGSRYGVDGVGAAQAAVITGALASHSFPAPPDKASHAMSFTIKVK